MELRESGRAVKRWRRAGQCDRSTRRLAEIVAGARKTVYGYHTGIDRISTRQHYNTATMVSETVETLDTRNRITSMMNRRLIDGVTTVFKSVSYTFDSLNRRDLATQEDSTFSDYTYNDRSEVTAAR